MDDREMARQRAEAAMVGTIEVRPPLLDDDEALPPTPPPESDKARLPKGFRLTQRGVFFDEEKEDGGTNNIWICSSLEVAAITRDRDGNNHGRLLCWNDSDNTRREWAMPMALTAGDCREVRQSLLDGGLEISSSAKGRRLLLDYISQTRPSAKARCTTTAGWFNGSFVLSDEVIGAKKGERLILQASDGTRSDHMKASGTLQEWKDNICSLAVGNPLLVFGMSMPFAAPLMRLVSIDGGGFNFRGPSSSGKTTILYAAASVCGPRNAFCRSWRATDNGLEGVATMHNDVLLPLDEIGQVDPRTAGEITYMLANGVGKSRANRVGAGRPAKEWRTLTLSTGELSLAEHMRTAGKQSRAGQEIRLLDIPVRGREHRAFDCLHGKESGAELAAAIARGCDAYYGQALREYLRKLVNHQGEVKAAFDDMKVQIVKAAGDKPSGQVRRAAERFALVATGGWMAAHWKIVSWSEKDAVAAATEAFKSWLTERGGSGDAETASLLESVSDFISLHGDSRFSEAEPTTINGQEIAAKVINRAGWWRDRDDDRVYLFTAAGLKEATRGFDMSQAIAVMDAAGWLIEKGSKRASKSVRIGSRVERLYHIVPKMPETGN